MSFIDKIIDHKRSELIARKMLRPENDLKRSSHFNKQPVSLFKILDESSVPAVIAEFKRRSPSAGYLNQYALVSEVVPGYQDAGAAAISVLTDTYFFNGTLNDLAEAKSLVRLPVLRKDFIIDPYQLIEAKSYGADVVLLICAILEKEQVQELYHMASDLKLEVLFEIHQQRELEKLPLGMKLVGINNRDLGTMKVDVTISQELALHIPADVILIAESGLTDTETVRRLWYSGYKGFLVGEYFMKHVAPAQACANFINRLNPDK